MARLVGPPYQAQDGDRQSPARSPRPHRLGGAVAVAGALVGVGSGADRGDGHLGPAAGTAGGSRPSGDSPNCSASLAARCARRSPSSEVKGLVTQAARQRHAHCRPPPHSLFTGPDRLRASYLSDRETTELLDLRETIEPGDRRSCRRAGHRGRRRGDPAARRALRSSGMPTSSGGSQLDAQFHQAIARATHNDLLVRASSSAS